MPFEKVKHLRLLSIILEFIKICIFPIAPLMIVIYTYNLYEKINVDKYAIAFWVLLIVIAINILKYVMSQIKLKDAYSNAQYMTRFCIEGLLTSLKWIIILVVGIVIIKSLHSVDITSIETVRAMLGMILIFIILKIVEIWFETLLIKPCNFAMENRHYAYLKSHIENQTQYIK